MEAVNVGTGPSDLSIHASVRIAVRGMGTRPMEVAVVKHLRDPDWRYGKGMLRKRKRAKGESYVSPSTGKTVPSHSSLQL